MAQPPEGTPDSAGSRNLKLDVDEMGAHFFSAAEQERSLFEAKKKSYLRLALVISLVLVLILSLVLLFGVLKIRSLKTGKDPLKEFRDKSKIPHLGRKLEEEKESGSLWADYERRLQNGAPMVPQGEEAIITEELPEGWDAEYDELSKKKPKPPPKPKPTPKPKVKYEKILVPVPCPIPVPVPTPPPTPMIVEATTPCPTPAPTFCPTPALGLPVKKKAFEKQVLIDAAKYSKNVKLTPKPPPPPKKKHVKGSYRRNLGEEEEEEVVTDQQTEILEHEHEDGEQEIEIDSYGAEALMDEEDRHRRTQEEAIIDPALIIADEIEQGMEYVLLPTTEDGEEDAIIIEGEIDVESMNVGQFALQNNNQGNKGYIFYQNGKKYYMYESKVYKVEKVPVPPKSNYKDGKPVRTIDGLYEILYQLPNPSEVAAHVKCFAKIEATKLYPIVKEYFKYGHIKTKPYRKLEEVKQN